MLLARYNPSASDKANRTHVDAFLQTLLVEHRHVDDVGGWQARQSETRWAGRPRPSVDAPSLPLGSLMTLSGLSQGTKSWNWRVRQPAVVCDDVVLDMGFGGTLVWFTLVWFSNVVMFSRERGFAASSALFQWSWDDIVRYTVIF